MNFSKTVKMKLECHLIAKIYSECFNDAKTNNLFGINKKILNENYWDV